MITDLEITNFQSHKNTVLSFPPGVSVILGPSDVGKSSIIRAINWAVSNRPSGDSFRSNLSDKSTEVAIGFGEEYISRKKGKGINGYSTGRGEYKALRTDVPEDVKTTTCMEDVNIQPQYKSYFLLDETPGNVAKAFNSVSGLEEMDAALKNVNSRVRQTSSTLAINLKEAVATEEQIKSMDWLSSAESLLADLEKNKKKIESKREKIESVRRTLCLVAEAQEKLNALPSAEALPAIHEIFSLDAAIDAKIVIQNNLHKLLESLSLLGNKRSRYEVLKDVDLSTTAQISQRIKEKSNKIFALHEYCEGISEKTHMLKRNVVELKERRKIYKELEAQLEICPECGQIIQGTHEKP